MLWFGGATPPPFRVNLTFPLNKPGLYASGQLVLYIYACIYVHMYICMYNYISLALHMYIYIIYSSGLTRIARPCPGSLLAQTFQWTLSRIYTYIYIYIHIYWSIVALTSGSSRKREGETRKKARNRRVFYSRCFAVEVGRSRGLRSIRFHVTGVTAASSGTHTRWCRKQASSLALSSAPVAAGVGRLAWRSGAPSTGCVDTGGGPRRYRQGSPWRQPWLWGGASRGHIPLMRLILETLGGHICIQLFIYR